MLTEPSCDERSLTSGAAQVCLPRAIGGVRAARNGYAVKGRASSFDKQYLVWSQLAETWQAENMGAAVRAEIFGIVKQGSRTNQNFSVI